MLDAPTKARIDSARDILVGKVPDPKSQVEQITIALIYKFMDDMDRQSETLGGKASFFQGEFRKYRWADLLDKRRGGHERLTLYAEGIERMNQNPNIPQLFRDIFKGVFLPYRDPETLNLFLKEIHGFTYEHSERLGDAYEYLLSVLGTQGDAGQFRTPRHIIDFIVAVMDPQKHETILDPTCGTAGFLISAYKHILAAHSPKGPTRPAAAPLTPDERARLMTNFRGYDIAPDMVRLSRVNLYLHGFPNPVIHEYDTLTSEERWDERYDVIMANPPFMTPKGGIRPHNRFSIQAKRSEVLFVDYIAEHLNPGGRAGIIVPEGIIFQSQNAYKNLRKMLVENYLWSVVSLPAGVFNPYSGVKTSILFLDRALAQRAADVLFVKIENDGFDLGAQRRPIAANDLPATFRALQEWKIAPRPTRPAEQTGPAHAVPRKRLLAAPDISLSGDRYRAVEVRTGKWPMVKLGNIAKIGAGDGAPQDDARFLEGTIPFFRTSDVGEIHLTPDFRTARDWLNEKAVKELRLTIWPPKTILFPKSGASTFLNHRVMLGCRGCVSSHLATILVNLSKAIPEYVYHLLCRVDARTLTENQNYPSLRLSEIAGIEIPLPPLAEQERLVAELEGYRQIIEAARQILTHYKPTLRINPKWPEANLDSLATFKNGINYSKQNKGTGIKVLGVAAFQDNLVAPTEGLDEINPKGVVTDADLLQDGDIVFVRSNGNKALVGRSVVVQTRGEMLTHSAFTIRLRFKRKNTVPLFYAFLFRNPTYRTQLMGRGANINNLSQDILRRLVVPLPPLSIQREIVAELEAERALVEANRALIARMEQKLAAKLAEIWGAPFIAPSERSDSSNPSDSPP